MTNEMKCSLTHDLLPAYIEGLTSEGSSAFIAAHLVECEKCRAAYRVMAEQNKGVKNDYGAVLSRLIKRRRRRRIIAAVTAGLIVLAALAVCFAPLPRRMSGTETAWLRHGDGTEGRAVTVTLDAWYMDYLLRGDTMEGTFSIEGDSRTDGALRAVFSHGRGLMDYVGADGFLVHVGEIILDQRSDAFAFCLYDESGVWNGDVLTSGAQNDDEAILLTRELAQRLFPGFVGAAS